MPQKHTHLRPAQGPRISKLMHAVRLRDFFVKLEPDSVAIIASNPEHTRNNDNEYSYRQCSDILYLNGFPEPQSALAITNFDSKPHLIMFVQPKDPEQETWTGHRWGPQGAKKHFLADEAHETDHLETVLEPLFKRAKNIYYRFGYNHQVDHRIQKLWSQRQVTLRNPQEILAKMRLFKQEAELAVMRHAATITAEAHCEAMRRCRPGMWEFQLQAIMESTFRIQGASGTAYETIVAGGKNAGILHYSRNLDGLRNEQLVLIDAGCEYEGYAADITRTFPVNGKFTGAQKEIYEVVLTAQLAAIKRARPGVPLSTVHTAARVALCQGLVRLGILPKSCLLGDYIAAHGLGRFSPEAGKRRRLHLLDLFMHGTSHWLGLDVHDVGSYETEDGTRSDKGKGKQRKLEPGMVITVEPGLYFSSPDPEIRRLIRRYVPKRYHGIGIRIEDDLIITDSGNEVITAAVPKAIDQIEALMAHRA